MGFDIERHQYGEARYSAQLVIQDIRTIHGSQFKDACLIVASPPCQEFSYMAMPWKRGKQIAAALRGSGKFPDGHDGSLTIEDLTSLFDTCFRIQREASEAAGRWIPMVVENVKGAQPWIGRAQAHYGSFYLWGDVQMVGSKIVASGPLDWNRPFLKRPKRSGVKVPGMSWSGFGDPDYVAKGFNTTADQNNRNGVKVPGQKHGEEYAMTRRAVKNSGNGSWFNIAHNKVIPGNQAGAPNRGDGLKTMGHFNQRDGYSHTRHLTNQRASDAVKQAGLSGPAWFDQGAAAHSSKSLSRKAASAAIAKIPFELACYIGRVYYP